MLVNSYALGNGIERGITENEVIIDGKPYAVNLTKDGRPIVMVGDLVLARLCTICSTLKLRKYLEVDPRQVKSVMGRCIGCICAAKN